MRTNVKAYTDNQIITKAESLEGFKGWRKGKYDFWVRSNEDEGNVFDDKVYSFEVEKINGEPKFVMRCQGTSNAGFGGLFNFGRYNKYGCAIVATGYFYYDSHYFGYHRRRKYGKRHPAYIQGKKLYYYRDNNKNRKAEEIGKRHFGVRGFNCHRAGWFSTIIGDHSWGCLVRNNRRAYDKWLRYMNKRNLHLGIIQEW